MRRIVIGYWIHTRKFSSGLSIPGMVRVLTLTTCIISS
ncbi:hypothetical protein Goshw_020665 [Gossypium schwendimanii]|uniref:Uncharacterized protein n=1 Tax=Gossypium schwendimanii TaxID=34291 RepID=A0A7J9NED7_GOSSC|nr:hypothetical protein [Gossypium schwendimanii]